MVSAMELRDVAVRETITRQSVDIGEGAATQVLNETAVVGRLTRRLHDARLWKLLMSASKTAVLGRYAGQAQGGAMRCQPSVPALSKKFSKAAAQNRRSRRTSQA